MSLICCVSFGEECTNCFSISFRWIQRNEEVRKVLEALDHIEDIVTKEALIIELKRVTF